MAELRMPLVNHGPSGNPACIRVEPADEGNVYVRLDAEDESEPWVGRTLTPDEARALSAALWHYAEEAERRP